MATKIGFIGSGGIARAHHSYLSTLEDVVLTAFCDVDEVRARSVAAEYDAKAYSEFAQMLEAESLDAVFICTPPFAHGDIEAACIDAGLPMFIEKPLATNMATARKIENAVNAKGLITAVGYHWRYQGATVMARELLADQRVAFVEGVWYGGMPGVYWWRQMALSGGQMVEQCTHIVDLARYLVGEIQSVAAYGAKGIMAKKVEKHDVWDSQLSAVRFDNGVVGHLSTSNALSIDGRAGLTLYCPELKLDVTGALSLTRPGEQTTHTDGPGWRNPNNAEDDAFLKAVTTGDRSGIFSDYTDAMKTLAVSLAINKSCETGQPVTVADV